MMLVNPCRNIITLQELIDNDNISEYLYTVESIGIYSEKNQSVIDFGSYAYLSRETIDGCTYVAPTTLDPTRVILLQNLLDDIANDLRSGRKRIKSIWSTDIYHLKPFFSWLDFEAPNNSLHDEYELNSRYIEYTDHLINLKLNNKNLDDFTSRRQHAARKFFRLASTNPKFSLGQGVPIISMPKGRPVPPPEEASVTENLTMAYQLFTELSDFVLSAAPFPFILKLPKESVFVVPCTTWLLTKARLAERDSMKNPNWRWDYQTGTINSAEYVQKKYGYYPAKARDEIAKSLKLLNAANENPRHNKRLFLASWAQTAFQILMLSATGIDLESFRNLPWSDDIISVTSERQGFRVYKARAKKFVYFEVQSAFVPLLNKYLKLRHFILNGKQCKYLFFRIQDGTAVRICDQFLQTYHDSAARMLDPALPRITATEYRKYKANWILNNRGIEIASLVTQNSIPVFSSRYSSSAKKIRQQEFTKFYSFLTNLSDSVIEKTIYTPSGGCTGDQHPADIGADEGVEKDCKTFMGCLFCVHYTLHADAEDLFKLKSMIYTIEIVRDNTPDFTQELSQTLDRAYYYVNLLMEQNPELIETVKKIDNQINEGNLQSYWQAYIDLWALTGKIK